jgi:hypothetical protein
MLTGDRGQYLNDTGLSFWLGAQANHLLDLELGFHFYFVVRMDEFDNREYAIGFNSKNDMVWGWERLFAAV